MTEKVARSVESLLAQHEAWRKKTLNLIASENLISPDVRQLLNNDLVGRYTDYNDRDLTSRRYQGNQYVIEIEQEAEALAQRLFNAVAVELRPLSGHIAGACVILGLCSPGDVILEVGRDGGSHRMATKLAQSKSISITSHFLPFDQSCWNVDVESAIQLIHEKQPKMVILGSSGFLFPHPVRDIRNALDKIPGSMLAYDASHVMGLIAGKAFQNPLVEGADVVYGSTHKTLPGPQGGIIFSNNLVLMERIATAVYPPLITNHHSFRIPALARAFKEMGEHGAAYAEQTIANAQRLGRELKKLGLRPVEAGGVYTQSHCILAAIPEFDGSPAQRLEGAEIIAGDFIAPQNLGSIGLRFGTQEITRMGAHEEDMQVVANLVVDAIRYPETVKFISERVEHFVSGLPGLAFA